MARRLNHPDFLLQTLRKPKHSVIHVKNLSGNAWVGVDVWGRTENGRVNKYQPVLISASISLEKDFESAASSDSVDGSTVHYGVLSKEILRVVGLRDAGVPSGMEAEKDAGVAAILGMDWSLTVFLDALHCWLTQIPFSFCLHPEKGEVYQRSPYLLAKSSNGLAHRLVARADDMELCCFLPKGSILGSGVSLRVLTSLSTVCTILKIHDLRVPAVIGVNANERLAKQMIVANVEIDGYLAFKVDLYHKLEQIVVKTIEESSFETLETLGTHLVRRIGKWFIYSEMDYSLDLDHPSPSVPANASSPSSDASPPRFRQLITITLEKPSAVTFAESPMVELRRRADPGADLLKGTLSDILARSREMSVPFPLQGRLDNWIRAKDPNDAT